MKLSITSRSLINSVNRKYHHAYSDLDIIDSLNDLEQSIFNEIINKYEVQYYSLKKDQTQYDMPINTTINDLQKVYLKTNQSYKARELYKIDSTFDGVYGYWNEQNKLNIFPVPTKDDTIYIGLENEITFANNSITTIGDNFSDFTVGDVVQITGCEDETLNNKYAVITGISDTVLTFGYGTFIEQAETTSVTISKCSLKVVYKYIPTLKTLAGIDTEILELPDSFRNLYEYYIISQIAIWDKETPDIATYGQLYNARLKDFERWYSENRVTYSDTDIESRLRNYVSADFDRG